MALALLGAGVLTGAIGLAAALYALATFLLGSPISDWGQLTRMGWCAQAVSAAYLWLARNVAVPAAPRASASLPLVYQVGLCDRIVRGVESSVIVL